VVSAEEVGQWREKEGKERRGKKKRKKEKKLGRKRKVDQGRDKQINISTEWKREIGNNKLKKKKRIKIKI
jgi:hypothetical protein